LEEIVLNDSPQTAEMQLERTTMEAEKPRSSFRVLVVDDDDALRGALVEYLQLRGMKVKSCPDGQDALDHIHAEREAYDVVLADLRMPSVGGLDVLRAAKARHAATEVVIITGFGSLDTAFESMRQGAFDYIAKPFKLVEIDLVLSRIAEKKKLLDENQYLQERVQSLYTRLDLLKDNRARFDKFVSETSQQLETQAQKLSECLDLIRQVSVHLGITNTPSNVSFRQ